MKDDIYHDALTKLLTVSGLDRGADPDSVPDVRSRHAL